MSVCVSVNRSRAADVLLAGAVLCMSVYLSSLSVCFVLCLFMSVCVSVNRSRAADVLLAGAVMNRVFQPHEIHIPYVLQVSFTCLRYRY